MTLFIAEYAGMAYMRSGSAQYPAPAAPTILVTQVSSGGSTAAMSTLTLSSATRLVSITSVGLNAFFAFGSSTQAPTSTQMEVAPSNVPILRGAIGPAGTPLRLFSFSS